ncbi:hypothetical protein GGQ65_003161 [Rhizobium fabae]|uniref:Uncharacterized protein n=1 Tax=Rhizobium fabae TaxID=573179 RepID=A0A7W6B5B2_9HYPH|nr:hypothetical protein [Rhizobium fabae]
MNAELVESAVGHIKTDRATGKKFSPKQSQPLFGKACDHRDDRRGSEGAGVEDRLADEFGSLPFSDGSHEMSTDEAVDHIQSTDAAKKSDQGDEKERGSSADIGCHEESDCADEPCRRHLERNLLVAHIRPRRVFGMNYSVKNSQGRATHEMSG